MSTKSDFTDEEWARLKRAPFVAGMAISLADPGGPIEAFKETKATLNTVRAAEDGSRGELGEVNRIATEKATPEDAAAIREWLLVAAQEAANAAKEGGFMGWHAERVSAGEQKMLDSLREVLSES